MTKMGNNKMTKNKIGNKEIDLRINLENMIPIQLDVTNQHLSIVDIFQNVVNIF